MDGFWDRLGRTASGFSFVVLTASAGPSIR